MPAGARVSVARRLTATWAPSTWIGVCVRVIHSSAEGPDHYIAAAWNPAKRIDRRWPDAVVIGSPTSERTLGELLRHLPTDAPLFLATPDDVDAALAAEILLATDRNLAAYQRKAIAAFIDAERSRVHREVAARYTDREADFERFVARVTRRS